MKVKVCCIVEIGLQDVDEAKDQVDALIQQRLDSFRETATRWGIRIYRADQLLDVVQELVRDVESVGPEEAQATWYDVSVTGKHARTALEKYGLPVSKITT